MATVVRSAVRSYGALAAVLVASTLAALLTFYTNVAESGRSYEEPDVRAVAARIDAACEDAWAAADVKPERQTDARTVARRLSLALVGTVPSLEELRRIASYPPESRIPRYLDELLASRRFADYWADRLARTYVGVDDGPFLVFRRRRFVYWLSDAIDEGMPYDKMVRDMVAGVGLWTDKPATNFITAHQRDPVTLTARTTRAFLGMRLDCAQCHDHPFSHWKQTDFEGLAAFYAGIEQTVTGIEDKGGEFRPGGRMMMMGDDLPVVEPRVPFAPEALPESGSRRQRLAIWLTTNPSFGKAIANRVWTMMFGRSLSEMGVDDIEGDERVAGVLATLADDFVQHDHDLRRLIHVIARTRAFQLRAASSREHAGADRKFASFPQVLLRAEQIAGSLVQLSSLHTVDAESHILTRLMRFGNTRNFVRRYGDAGTEELAEQSGTIMQRLVLMNGRVVRERTQANLFTGAGRIEALSPDDASRVRNAFLICLTREPTAAELAHFSADLSGKKGKPRQQAVEDMMWALVNTTEFSWTR